MEAVSFTKIAFALLFVIALIGLLAVIARVMKLPEKWAGAGQKSRRMEIKEVLYVDAKHKLVLLRRDSVEHLLLIGQGDSRVIESGLSPQGGVNAANS